MPLKSQLSHVYFQVGWCAANSVVDQILPKLPGNQRPIGRVERFDALENVLVFNHGHFAAAGVEKSSTTAKVGV
jgi:hypothetical protein